MDLLMMHALNAEREVELRRAERRRVRGIPTPHPWRLLRELARKATDAVRTAIAARRPVHLQPAVPMLPEKGEPVMMTCALCKFATPMDDVVLAGPAGRCVCLRCYTRETGTTRRMSSALEQRLRGVLERV